ncbi:MAG TPA: iron chelate uptake ABC transporter family permease subunit [Thermoanaerobaculia bacterium]|nr:iron chelate uptake ABC transporter family permease subunit [Thermoanaerobaculia bacterium]
MSFDVLVFLAAPFAACLVLVGILGYFGLHVLLREVIFVDLALAQIAALGTVVAFAAGHSPSSRAAFLYSLTATVLGAAIFTVTRRRKGAAVPQEAIIGITYVIASAAAIVVADRAPEGAEHIKELLAGTILWVSWGEVARQLAVAAVVGLFHWFFRRRFLRISEDAEAAAAEGISVRFWDFLFYLSFGLVITVAVSVAGVLMVFAYLVAPAIIALGTSRRWGARIVLAWTAGALASALGLLSSYGWDFPSGPAVVCALGLFLVLYGGWRGVRSRLGRRPAPAPSG